MKTKNEKSPWMGILIPRDPEIQKGLAAIRKMGFTQAPWVGRILKERLIADGLIKNDGKNN